MKKQATSTDSDLAQRDDSQLIEGCLAGDGAAWEVLISRYKRLIYSVPVKLRLSPDDAADIFQWHNTGTVSSKNEETPDGKL